MITKSLILSSVWCNTDKIYSYIVNNWVFSPCTIYTAAVALNICQEQNQYWYKKK